MSGSIPLPALANVERAVLALLEAVRAAQSPPAVNATSGAAARSPMILDTVNEFLLAKARAERSDRYLKTTMAQLRAFAEGKHRWKLSQVTSLEIERWLYDNDWTAETRRGYLLTVRTFFNFAVERMYIGMNPALGVDLPFVAVKPPMVHTPHQVRHVLDVAMKQCPSACRCMAIRYFAGLRTTEAVSLDESQIQPGRGFIEVGADKSKTRTRRLVKVEPNLIEWLIATKLAGGQLPLRQSMNTLWRLTRECGVPWAKNVTRHTFVSYHLAKFQNAGNTALEAGHAEKILFRHYREVVTPEAADEFWKIRPNPVL